MNFLIRGFNHCHALLTGLGVTLRYLVTPKMTQEYPEKPGPLEPRYRGRHTQRRYENGLERCVGCSLCAIYCPAYAIFVEAEENDPENPVSPGERHAKTYEIDMLRCIYCGLCEEACPEDAIQLSYQPGDPDDPDDIKARYELANYERPQRFLFDKEMLLEPLTEKMKAKRARELEDSKKSKEEVD